MFSIPYPLDHNLSIKRTFITGALTHYQRTPHGTWNLHTYQKCTVLTPIGLFHNLANTPWFGVAAAVASAVWYRRPIVFLIYARVNRELCRKRRPTRDEDMMVWRVERGGWKLNWFV